MTGTITGECLGRASDWVNLQAGPAIGATSGPGQRLGRASDWGNV